jgi:hypothetical protein
MTRVITPIRRAFSRTPLAQTYEASLGGERRARRKIPWDGFDRALYPEAALELAADAQLRLAEGEYHAIGLFGRIASGVAMAGAPFDIVSAATRISSDELRHADYCTRLASLFRGHPMTLSIDRAALADAAPVLPVEAEADFLVAKYAAVGETLAAALLRACRERATDPVARAHFSSILGDEVHHAHFGWYYLTWRAPLWSERERRAVGERLGEFVADIEWALWFGRDAPESARAAADALGVLDSDSQRAVVKEVMETEIVPGLDALGLGASAAWRERRRGPSHEMPARELVFGGTQAGALPRSGDALRPKANPIDVEGAASRAASYLSAQVASDGQVTFAVDAVTGETEPLGAMHHGRTALVVRALALQGDHPDAWARARTRLAEDISASLGGRPVPAWPDDVALVAATLALASLAGLDVHAALAPLARAPEVMRTPWYAAQVATALGPEAPPELLAACRAGLDADDWAPWTALAARVAGDAPLLARAEQSLIGSVRDDGAVCGPGGPEIARAAVVIEALAPFTTDASRAAAKRALRFLAAQQLENGALPLTPESTVLRVDATAHALLAFMVAPR